MQQEVDMAEDFLLALEGGGTRSQAALLTAGGQVLALVNSGDVNTNFTTFERAQANVQSAVKQVLALTEALPEQVTCLVSALVGPRFGAETFSTLLPRAAYRYYNERDVVFARAGIYHPHGVALVAATGATAFAVRADDGRQASFGGWGSLLGDEGSAYDLGLAGLRAAARAYEGREDAPALVAAACRHYDLDPDGFKGALIRLAYGRPLSRAEIAGFAVEVTALAAQGDEAAARLSARAAADLSALALHAARQFFKREEAFQVVAAGGLTSAGDLLMAALRADLAQDFPRAVLRIASDPPAVALGRLAQDEPLGGRG